MGLNNDQKEIKRLEREYSYMKKLQADDDYTRDRLMENRISLLERIVSLRGKLLSRFLGK